MILTEEEAKLRYCPETFNAIAASGSVFKEVRCIASQCMAWRWFDNTDDQAVKTPRGYCGKAGKP